eukprot:gene12537-49058_t
MPQHAGGRTWFWEEVERRNLIKQIVWDKGAARAWTDNVMREADGEKLCPLCRTPFRSARRADSNDPDEIKIAHELRIKVEDGRGAGPAAGDPRDEPQEVGDGVAEHRCPFCGQNFAGARQLRNHRRKNTACGAASCVLRVGDWVTGFVLEAGHAAQVTNHMVDYHDGYACIRLGSPSNVVSEWKYAAFFRHAGS